MLMSKIVLLFTARATGSKMVSSRWGLQYFWLLKITTSLLYYSAYRLQQMNSVVATSSHNKIQLGLEHLGLNQLCSV